MANNNTLAGIQSAAEEVIDPTTLSIKLNESKDETALAREAILSAEKDSQLKQESQPNQTTPDFDEIIRAKFSTDIQNDRPMKKEPESDGSVQLNNIESDIVAEIAALERQLSSNLDPLSPIPPILTRAPEVEEVVIPSQPTPPPPQTLPPRGSSLRDKIRGLHNAREKLMTACPASEKAPGSKPPVFPKPLMKNRSKETIGMERYNSLESDKSRSSSSKSSLNSISKTSGLQETFDEEKFETPLAIAECSTPAVNEEDQTATNFEESKIRSSLSPLFTTGVVVESVSQTKESVDVSVSVTFPLHATSKRAVTELDGIRQKTTSIEHEITPPQQKITSEPTSSNGSSKGVEIQSLSELISSFSPKTEAESSSEEPVPVSQPRGSSPTNEALVCGSCDSVKGSLDDITSSLGDELHLAGGLSVSKGDIGKCCSITQY